MAVLYPGDDFGRVFRVLVDALGADPKSLRTTTDGPGLGLVLPDELYDRFVEAEGAQAEPETPRKRPGRPRKSQES